MKRHFLGLRDVRISEDRYGIVKIEANYAGRHLAEFGYGLPRRKRAARAELESIFSCYFLAGRDGSVRL